MKFLSQINVNTEYTLPIVDGTNGQVLSTDGLGVAYWGTISAGSLTLDGLSDVVITSPASNQLIRYGIPLGSGDNIPVWHNFTPNFLTPSSSIDALGDVTITTAAAGQILQYNGTAWVNWTPNFLTAHPVILAASSVNNSNGTVIQDITLESNGHVTGLASVDLDTRYYTESEIDSFFLGESEIAGYNQSNWDTAYGWGDHAAVGYLTAIPAHTHTIANVTGLQTALDGKLSTSGKAADSELVDGIDSSRIVYGINQTKSTGIDGGDINAAISSGFYDGYNITGAPTGPTYYHVIANRHSNAGNNYQMQFAGAFFDHKEIYYRNINNGTTSAWGKIWTSQNDGAGTGLDADLLDGQQGSYYQPASTAITTSNIGSQSVSYAEESGYSASSGSVEWTNVQSKPATFPPSAHNHDDRYYTETESDSRFYLATNPSGYISSYVDTVTSVGIIDDLSTGDIVLKGGGATTITKVGGTITIISTDTDTNTTYSAGTGLTLSGTTFSVTSGTFAAASHTHAASDITSGTLSTDRLPKQELGISIVGNFGQWQAHTAYTNFNTDVAYWGWTFVQGNTNAPHQISSQWYRGRFSLGDEYGFGTSSADYWMEIAIPRYNQSSTSGNLFVRTANNGVINGWEGVRAAYATDAAYAADAGYAEESGYSVTSGSVEWTNVQNKPATFPPSAHTHAISDVTGLQTALDGKVPTTRTITINGTALDLSADRSFTVSSADGYISNVQLSESGLLKFAGEGSAFTGNIDLSTLPFQPVGSYLTAEADTLASVTGRGNTTTNSISVGSISVPSRINLTDAGVNNAFISESWGINLNGVITHPIQVRGGSFSVGYSLGGGTSYGSGNMFVSGNVGIGTTAPATKLHVDYTSGTGLTLSNTQANLYAEMRFQSANSSSYIFKSSNGYTSYGGANALNVFNEGQIAFHSSTVSNIMHLTAAGNVGINTAEPEYKLDVKGDGRFTSDLVVGGSLTETSSIRYKENVKSIPSVSQKVEQLDAVSYNKIGGSQEEIGLIAEDVAELFPEVVKYDDEGRPDGVNYSRLSVILLKAVQELTERVNKLENK